MRQRLPVVALVAALTGAAQPVQVFSEFQRVGPDGEVVEWDRTERPREILSPAVARNAWATYRVVVQVPEGQDYTLYLAQNPENLFTYKLYQENYGQFDGKWAPDEVVEVALPYSGKLSGRKAQSYLLDVWTPANAPVGRARLEVQLHSAGRWVIYPLEIRVMDPRAVTPDAGAFALPGVSARIDAGIEAPVRAFICETKPGAAEPAAGALTARSFVRRNVLQDLTIARAIENDRGRAVLRSMLLMAAGHASLPAYCGGKPAAAPRGAEWWLRARDYLYQGRVVK